MRSPSPLVVSASMSPLRRLSLTSLPSVYRNDVPESESWRIRSSTLQMLRWPYQIFRCHCDRAVIHAVNIAIAVENRTARRPENRKHIASRIYQFGSIAAIKLDRNFWQLIGIAVSIESLCEKSIIYALISHAKCIWRTQYILRLKSAVQNRILFRRQHQQ